MYPPSFLTSFLSLLSFSIIIPSLHPHHSRIHHLHAYPSSSHFFFFSTYTYLPFSFVVISYLLHRHLILFSPSSLMHCSPPCPCSFSSSFQCLPHPTLCSISLLPSVLPSSLLLHSPLFSILFSPSSFLHPSLSCLSFLFFLAFVTFSPFNILLPLPLSFLFFILFYFYLQGCTLFYIQSFSLSEDLHTAAIFSFSFLFPHFSRPLDVIKSTRFSYHVSLFPPYHPPSPHLTHSQRPPLSSLPPLLHSASPHSSPHSLPSINFLFISSRLTKLTTFLPAFQQFHFPSFLCSSRLFK